MTRCARGTHALAFKAGIYVRAVATAMKRLRELGILNWVRRCAESWRDGWFVLEQQSNAWYTVSLDRIISGCAIQHVGPGVDDRLNGTA